MIGCPINEGQDCSLSPCSVSSSSFLACFCRASLQGLTELEEGKTEKRPHCIAVSAGPTLGGVAAQTASVLSVNPICSEGTARGDEALWRRGGCFYISVFHRQNVQRLFVLV